jgi:hypothetical protein
VIPVKALYRSHLRGVNLTIPGDTQILPKSAYNQGENALLDTKQLHCRDGHKTLLYYPKTTHY